MTVMMTTIAMLVIKTTMLTAQAMTRMMILVVMIVTITVLKMKMTTTTNITSYCIKGCLLRLHIKHLIQSAILLVYVDIAAYMLTCASLKQQDILSVNKTSTSVQSFRLDTRNNWSGMDYSCTHAP